MDNQQGHTVQHKKINKVGCSYNIEKKKKTVLRMGENNYKGSN